MKQKSLNQICLKEKSEKSLANSTNFRKKYVRFNSKGYFYNVQPFSEQYLKAKHAAYNKFRNNENKENFVYNLPKQTPAIGYYIMKGYKPQKSNKTSIQVDQSLSKCTLTQSTDIIDNFMKKYLLRRQKLKEKSSKKHQKIFLKFQNTIVIPDIINIHDHIKNRSKALSMCLKNENAKTQCRQRAKTQSSIYTPSVNQNRRYLKNYSKATIQ